jgi:hypothetical protein
MQDLPSLSCEREDMAAAGRLIVNAIDGLAGRVAEQQRADGAVADEENIPRPIARQYRFGFTDDARLCVDRALPAADAEMRLGEKLIGDVLEFGRV